MKKPSVKAIRALVPGAEADRMAAETFGDYAWAHQGTGWIFMPRVALEEKLAAKAGSPAFGLWKKGRGRTDHEHSASFYPRFTRNLEESWRLLEVLCTKGIYIGIHPTADCYNVGDMLKCRWIVQDAKVEMGIVRAALLLYWYPDGEPARSKAQKRMPLTARDIADVDAKKPQTVNVKHCTSCGQAHIGVKFKPCASDRGTHEAKCPVTKKAIHLTVTVK